MTIVFPLFKLTNELVGVLPDVTKLSVSPSASVNNDIPPVVIVVFVCAGND